MSVINAWRACYLWRIILLQTLKLKWLDFSRVLSVTAADKMNWSFSASSEIRPVLFTWLISGIQMWNTLFLCMASRQEDVTFWYFNSLGCFLVCLVFVLIEWIRKETQTVASCRPGSLLDVKGSDAVCPYWQIQCNKLCMIKTFKGWCRQILFQWTLISIMFQKNVQSYF